MCQDNAKSEDRMRIERNAYDNNQRSRILSELMQKREIMLKQLLDVQLAINAAMLVEHI